MAEHEWQPPTGVDTSSPNLARVYDSLLGGKDNFEVDRELHRQLEQLVPEIGDVARENRKWLGRAVRWLVRVAGVDQFLDLGSGLPTTQNTHEIAQAVDPDSIVVYVDNDPTVIAHGRVLLDDNDRSFFCPGDLADPAAVFDHPVVKEHLDLDRPIGLLHGLTLHHIAELERAQQVMVGYVERLPVGSYVAMSNIGRPAEDSPEAGRVFEGVERLREIAGGFTLRSHDELATLLPGLEPVEPGLAVASDWWPEGPRPDRLPYALTLLVAGVARKA
ncbi:MAG: hypothetical protein GEV07_12940 [Streptosporangiales bacterium]|nr:hypothetical protein [Streptosporangiales bacterium]